MLHALYCPLHLKSESRACPKRTRKFTSREGGETVHPFGKGVPPLVLPYVGREVLMRNASFLADVHFQVAPEAVHLLGAGHVVLVVDLDSSYEFITSMTNIPVNRDRLFR